MLRILVWIGGKSAFCRRGGKFPNAARFIGCSLGFPEALQVRYSTEGPVVSTSRKIPCPDIADARVSWKEMHSSSAGWRCTFSSFSSPVLGMHVLFLQDTQQERGVFSSSSRCRAMCGHEGRFFPPFDFARWCNGLRRRVVFPSAFLSIDEFVLPG